MIANIIPQSLLHILIPIISDFRLPIKPQCQELIPYNCTGFPLTLIPVVNSWQITKRVTIKTNSILEKKIRIYWSKSNYWIYFYIILNKNLKNLLVLGHRTGAHREDWTDNPIQSKFDLYVICLLTLLSEHLFPSRKILELSDLYDLWDDKAQLHSQCPKQLHLCPTIKTWISL